MEERLFLFFVYLQRCSALCLDLLGHFVFTYLLILYFLQTSPLWPFGQIDASSEAECLQEIFECRSEAGFYSKSIKKRNSSFSISVVRDVISLQAKLQFSVPTVQKLLQKESASWQRLNSSFSELVNHLFKKVNSFQKKNRSLRLVKKRSPVTGNLAL